ncbi:MAG: hypothetical protein NZ899_05375 [Thermoguttaceae bacterium]|nr:hypothetical protein [Thermoguttaceae bacterium]MDW8078254.1 hypothetical protein [Thermoguttaceae bacterium]
MAGPERLTGRDRVLREYFDLRFVADPWSLKPRLLVAAVLPLPVVLSGPANPEVHGPKTPPSWNQVPHRRLLE